MGAGAGQAPARTHRASRRGRRGRHAAGGLRRAPARRALDRALSVPRRRRPRPATSRAACEPVPRRRAPGGLPARAAAEGAPHAARQPADRRRRRARQDHRSGADPDRVAAPAPHPPRPGARARGPPVAMARRAVGEILSALRGGRPPPDGPHAPPPRHGRQSVAFVRPDRRLVPLPAPAGRTRAVPGGLPHPGRLPAPAVGPADRRRVPQPDAFAVRGGQRAVPHAAAGGSAIRASAVPVRDAAQRPHAVVHRPPGDARPGALHPHRRDDRRDAQARRRRGHPSPEARDQRRKLCAALLPPESTEVPATRLRPARIGAVGGVRRIPPSRTPSRGRRDNEAPRRHLRRRDSGQAAAVVSHRLRGVLGAGRNRGSPNRRPPRNRT